MSIITLTTDFGLKDHFAGIFKGKIYSLFPETNIIDISHSIDKFNVLEASYLLATSYAHFPKGTVHVVAVDASRNADTNHIAMLYDGHYFIGADNGILSMLTQKVVPQKMVAITIHDRLHNDATDMDVFVKVACHLSKGGLLNVIGKEITQLQVVTGLQASVASNLNSIKGNVIYIDHFGNVVTNISKKQFLDVAKGRPYEIVMKNKNIKTILPNYSSIASNEKYAVKNYEGEKLAIFNEAGFLEIAIFRSNPSKIGSANSLLGLSYRDVVLIQFNE